MIELVDMLSAGDKIASVLGAAVGASALWLARLQARRSETSASRASSALDSAIESASSAADGAAEVAVAEKIQQFDEPLSERIGRVAQSLHDSRLLIGELQSEMEARMAAVERLRAQEEKNRHLAAVQENEAAAVRDLLSSVIDSAHEALQAQLRQERRDMRGQLSEVQKVLAETQAAGRKDQLRFFLYGVGASIPVGILINIFF